MEDYNPYEWQLSLTRSIRKLFEMHDYEKVISLHTGDKTLFHTGDGCRVWFNNRRVITQVKRASRQLKLNYHIIGETPDGFEVQFSKPQ